ncbi:sulfite oxidase [Cryomorphaceae bacterium 1068]|nr:sulfite oxidase [Cryomorphaceae bacterium 1068]
MMKCINRMSLLHLTMMVALISISQSLFSQYDVNEAPTEWKNKEMIVHNDRPWNIETPVHLLDDPFTPTDKMFVRNNGLVPTDLNAEEWTLTIEGESVPNPKTYTLAELKSKFKHYTYALVLECGGNGRSEMNPPATGNQWSYGAVNCGKWTGVRLRDVLEDVGISDDAVYVGYYGTDKHLSGDPKKVVISRGVPMEKAMEDETLIAFELNGEEIPIVHGYPLRLVVGGWPASVSGKWLNKLVVRNKIHDGPKMEAPSYSVPKNPVAPGTEVAKEDMMIIESMPVKSVITYPKTGAMVKSGQEIKVRGHAWAGDLKVAKVEISTDYGQTWEDANLKEPINRLSWQDFNTSVVLKEPGYYEIWVRATDENGKSQPMVVPGWNPRGYLNNATHRIAIKVE